MNVTPEVRAAAALAVRDKVRIGPLGPNATSILAGGGPTHLTSSEAETAADAVLDLLAYLDRIRGDVAPAAVPERAVAPADEAVSVLIATRVLGEHRLVATSPRVRHCSCGFLLKEPDWSTEELRLERHRAHQAAAVLAATSTGAGGHACTVVCEGRPGHHVPSVTIDLADGAPAASDLRGEIFDIVEGVLGRCQIDGLDPVGELADVLARRFSG